MVRIEGTKRTPEIGEAFSAVTNNRGRLPAPIFSKGERMQFDTPKTKTLREALNDPRIVGLSIEADGVFIYTNSAEWCDAYGAGTFRADTETAAVRKFKSEVRKAKRGTLMIMIEGKTTQLPGDRVFEVSWQTLRPAAASANLYGGDEIDVDRDLENNVKMFSTKAAALKAAHEIWAVTDLYWGVVTVQEYRAEAMEHNPRIGTWEPVGESIEISEPGNDNSL